MSSREPDVTGLRFYGAEEVHQAVLAMPVGTRFTETDEDGREHHILKVFNGRVMFDNGFRGEVEYGDVDEDAWIEITHVPVDAEFTERDLDNMALWLGDIETWIDKRVSK